MTYSNASNFQNRKKEPYRVRSEENLDNTAVVFEVRSLLREKKNQRRSEKNKINHYY
jgi:hypothetical protein